MLRQRNAESMAITCDGCSQPRSPADLLYIHDYGHEVRYCAECVAVYHQFVVTCQAEEQRRQRELDLWMLERRTHVPLRLMPMDLPPVAASSQATGTVLG